MDFVTSIPVSTNWEGETQLEANFFGPFRVLHAVGSQAYKLEPLKKWKIHVFHVLLLGLDTTRKGRVDEATSQFEFDDSGGREKYEVGAIRDSAVYARESDSGHLSGLYYLVVWKGYPEERTSGNLHRPSGNSGDNSAPSIRSTQKGRQQAYPRSKRGGPAKASDDKKRAEKS